MVEELGFETVCKLFPLLEPKPYEDDIVKHQFVPKDVVIGFASGLVPVLKHADHDQLSHGRWARSMRGYEERTPSGKGQLSQGSDEAPSNQARREALENIDYIMGRTTRAPDWTGPSDPLYVPARSLSERVQSARRKIAAWKQSRDRRSMERMTSAELETLGSKNRERARRKREKLGLPPFVAKSFDPVYEILQRIFVDVVEPSLWVELVEDPRSLVDLTGPLGDLVDDMLDAVAPQGTVIKFAPGLRPVLKHQKGKHDQKLHGSWADQMELEGLGLEDSAAFSEWGDRADELTRALFTGPNEFEIRDAVSPNPDSVSGMAVRERIKEYYESYLEDDVGERMSRMESMGTMGSARYEDNAKYDGLSYDSLRNKLYEELVDEYVADYGGLASQQIAAENSNINIDVDAMDEVYGIYHEGENLGGERISLQSNVNYVEKDGSTLQVNGDIYDKEGKHSGRFTRLFSTEDNGNVVVTHESLELDDKYQGAGFSKAFNRQAENYYISHGIETVKVHAAMEGGGYAWASSGFDWDFIKHKASINNVLQSMTDYMYRNQTVISETESGSRLPASLLSEIISVSNRLQSSPVSDADYPTPKEIADLGRIPGVSNWPGKEIMRGTNWYGIKTLRPEGARISNTQAANEENRVAQERYASERAPSAGQLTMDAAFSKGFLAQKPNFQPGLFSPIPGVEE